MKKFDILRSPEEDENDAVSGVEVFEEIQTEVKVEGDDEVEGEGDGEEVVPEPDAVPTFTPEAFATALKDALKKDDKTVESQPQLSQEEIDRRLGKYEVDESLVDVLLDNDVPKAQKVAALNKMLKGNYDYAVNTAYQVATALVQQQEQKFQPVMDSVQRQQLAGQKKVFYQKYPNLKEYPQLVDMAAAHLTSTGVKPKSQEEAFKLVAEAAMAVASKFDPSLKQQNGKTPGRMNKLSSGSSGGVGGTQPKQSNNRLADIWN